MAGAHRTPDPAERAAAARSGSRMMHGGFTAARPLSGADRAAFDALVDTLIPPEDGWPPSASLGIADLAAVYLVPDDHPQSFYPHFRASEFHELLGDLAPRLDGELDARVAGLRAFDAGDPLLFGRVRDFVYYVYYGHPAVVALIGTSTTNGGRYRGHSQPEGYALRGWEGRAMTRRGTFIPTADVRRVRPVTKGVTP